MSVTTVTQICNLALSRIGARRIAAFDSDTTVEAGSCRLHFELVRDGLLRRHQWDFAKVSAMLTKQAAAPESEYAAAWQMPTSCVRIIRLSTGDPHNPLQNYERRDRQILTADYETLELIHVSNAIPISHWDSLFIEALVLKLACRIAGDVTQNPALAQECNTEFEQLALPSAQTADAREGNSGEGFGLVALISQSTLGRARRGAMGAGAAALPYVTEQQIEDSTVGQDLDGIFNGGF